MGRMQMRRDAVNQRPDDARRNRIRHRGKRSKKTATTTTTTTATTTAISKRRRRRHVFGAGKNRKGVRSDPKLVDKKKLVFLYISTEYRPVELEFDRRSLVPRVGYFERANVSETKKKIESASVVVVVFLFFFFILDRRIFSFVSQRFRFYAAEK